MSPSRPSFNLQPILEKTGWNRMAKREQIMVGSLITVLTGLLFFSLVFSPLLESRQRLQKSLLKKQVELQKIHELQNEYQSLQQQAGDTQQRLTKRPVGFTLFSFIEQQATAAGIRQHINYIKPSNVASDGPLHESRVDMKLQQITLENLVTFLQGVESPENVVSISRISVQEHGKGQGTLDSVIQIVTYTKSEQE
jgi:general secretion pathway protein M